jgi:hypothetical protein
MYIDGSFGSHDTPGDGSDPLVPTGGNLASNADAPAVAPPFGSIAACNTLTAVEGQAFCNDLSMISNDAASPVFVADLTSVSLLGDDWELSLGANTFSGTASVPVEVSLNGSSYSLVDTLALTTVDTQFIVPLGAALNGANAVFVRLGLDAVSGSPIIDNLSLSAVTSAIPEPGTAFLMLVGLVGLHAMGRRNG